MPQHFPQIPFATNGNTAVLAKKITREHAIEIVESFSGQGRTIGPEPVDWTPGAQQLTWMVTVEKESE